MKLRLRLTFAVATFAILGAFSAVPGAQSHSQQNTVVKSVAYELPLFDTEEAAQRHCRHDIVVWLNLPTGIYHYKGERWYGRTRHGAFVCEKEAIAAGDRASMNGQ